MLLMGLHVWLFDGRVKYLVKENRLPILSWAAWITGMRGTKLFYSLGTPRSLTHGHEFSIALLAVP